MGRNRADANTKRAIMESIDIGEAVEASRDGDGQEKHVSPAEEEFVQRVAEGNTLARAYELSHDAEGMKRASVYQAASRLMDRPRVAARLAELVRDRQSKGLFKDAVYVRQHVFDRLLQESVDDKSTPTARIRALELLGKSDLVGIFRETEGSAKKERDPDSVAKELEDKLKAYIRQVKAENGKG